MATVRVDVDGPIAICTLDGCLDRDGSALLRNTIRSLSDEYELLVSLGRFELSGADAVRTLLNLVEEVRNLGGVLTMDGRDRQYVQA